MISNYLMINTAFRCPLINVTICFTVGKLITFEELNNTLARACLACNKTYLLNRNRLDDLISHLCQ
jgi:hypothetical protein